MLRFVLSILLSYLIGAINPAYLLGKLKGFDMRKRGSKNAGTFNTYETLGFLPAIFVFLIDAGKAILCFWLAKEIFFLSEIKVYLSSLFAIIGHRFPFYLNFRGGKGVAAGIGLGLAAVFFQSTLENESYFISFLIAVYVFVKYILKK